MDLQGGHLPKNRFFNKANLQTKNSEAPNI